MSTHLDIASLSAEWVAVAVTLIGLSSLILQLTNFQNMLDPFRDYRGLDWLGPWSANDKKQQSKPLIPIRGESPKGPELHGTYATGFCGLNDVHVSRKPLSGQTGKASWTAILAIFHPNPLPELRKSVSSFSPSGKAGEILLENVSVVESPERSWTQRLEPRQLIKHRDKICTKITRTAFITCLVLSNSYQLYKYSDAAGLRAAYTGYSGAWQVHWPLGGVAELEFFPLDSHNEGQEKHPLSFRRRTDKSVLMLVGILEHVALGKLAFSEPKEQGVSVLELLKRGYIAHGKPSHLFNMMGGNPYNVDYLYRRILPEEEEANYSHDIKIMIPTPELDLNRKPVKAWDITQKYSIVYVPSAEEKLLATALDCLPWSSLGWSIHRGMQCLLVAYGKRMMQQYRRAFAHTLKTAIETYPSALESQGWSPSLVRDFMPDNSAASVMAGGGDSGDSVRIVTAAARLLSQRPDAALDETRFWRDRVGKKQTPPIREVGETEALDEDTVIALTKLFVLEWSNELDHNLYEELPLFMYVA